MSTSTLSTTAWTEVATTTTDTVFQNRSNSPVYITTEATGSLDPTDGFYLGPSQAIIVSTGNTVSAYAFREAVELFYMEV